MIAVLHVDRFYALVARRALGVAQERAVCVVHEKGLLDSDDLAGRLRPGMTEPEAKAIDPSACYVPYSPGGPQGSEHETFETAREAWLDLAADASGTIEPGMPHEATMDLSGHPDPNDVACRLVRRLHRELGWTVRAGLAPSGWVARLALRECDPTGVLVGVDTLPQIDDAAEWLAGRPSDDLLPLDPKTRERLKFLGYGMVSQVQAAPLDALRSAFGPEGIRVHQAAIGQLAEPVKAAYPPDSLRVRKRIEGGTESREKLSSVAKRLAVRLAAQLRDKDSEAPSICLCLELEDGNYVRSERTFVKPMQGAAGLVLALERMLEGQLPEQPTVAMDVWLPKLKRGVRKQASLVWGGHQADADERVKQAVGPLQGVFGESAVLRASQLAEPRRVKVLRCWRDALGWQ